MYWGGRRLSTPQTQQSRSASCSLFYIPSHDGPPPITCGVPSCTQHHADPHARTHACAPKRRARMHTRMCPPHVMHTCTLAHCSGRLNIRARPARQPHTTLREISAAERKGRKLGPSRMRPRSRGRGDSTHRNPRTTCRQPAMLWPRATVPKQRSVVTVAVSRRQFYLFRCDNGHRSRTTGSLATR